MFLYNVHTPSKTFALPHKGRCDDDTANADGEDYRSLVDRILTKAGLSEEEAEAVRNRKDGAGVVYEFESRRFSLEDDSDLEILRTRLPPSSTTSATVHLTLPAHHAHFASPPHTASSALKSKLKKPKEPNGDSLKSKDFVESGATAAPVSGEKLSVVGHTDTKSVRSTASRRSKYGGDDREPMGESHKRAWHEFHNSTGVRTVMGKVGDVKNVRMLLKPGYRGVYVSRSFAIKNKLVPAKYAMGLSGYTGLKTLGQVPITVGSRTASHPVLINEEMHFDVVLGRTWVEKMGIKVDPNDQTILTYMDSGESIPCDIVVLKDAAGNKIHIT